MNNRGPFVMEEEEPADLIDYVAGPLSILFM